MQIIIFFFFCNNAPVVVPPPCVFSLAAAHYPPPRNGVLGFGRSSMAAKLRPNASAPGVPSSVPPLTPALRRRHHGHGVPAQPGPANSTAKAPKQPIGLSTVSLPPGLLRQPEFGR